jgi:hypothetical protein
VFLTASNLAPNLIARGLITAQSVVDGDFTIIEAGRRNRNFKVVREKAPGLFVKQVKSTAADAISTWQREVAFYQLVASQPAFAAFSGIVPKLIDAHPSTYSLTVELLPGAENLTEYHARVSDYPAPIGEMLGRGLGAYHSRASSIVSVAAAVPLFPRQLPWILNIGFPEDPLPQFGAIGQQFSGLLQQYPEILPRLMMVRQEWMIDSLIHGDMKWDNCLVFRREDDSEDVSVVDWELADLGDAAWDAGSIFASYLTYYLFTLPPSQSPEQAQAEAQTRLARLRPALAAFWGSYARTRGLQSALAGQYLRKCVRFAAAKLIQVAFEYVINFQQVNANTGALIYIARNIFQESERAIQELTGGVQQ